MFNKLVDEEGALGPSLAPQRDVMLLALSTSNVDLAI